MSEPSCRTVTEGSAQNQGAGIAGCCTASLVLFKTPPQMLHDLLEGIPSSVFVTIIDNSPTPALQAAVSGVTGTAYHHTGQNLGYGKGHNLGLSLSPPSDFHLIVNPDIIIAPGTLEQMLHVMQQDPGIGLLAPRFFHDDGSIQYLNRRFPTVLDLVLRHIPAGLRSQRMIQRVRRHEMQDADDDAVFDVESVSGAFMLCRRAVLERIGGFDPGYFMYFEDFDLSCTIREQGLRTACYPEVSVVHRWTRASSKEKRMILAHIQSMIRFFNKWGWRWA